MLFPVYLSAVLTFAASTVSTNDGFFISAPSVFHVGVKERVSVQLEKSLLNKKVYLYMEDEITRQLMTDRVQIIATKEGEIKTVELMVTRLQMAELSFNSIPYLLLVCETQPDQRKSTRVLVSQHRGYIFIQTDQPVYNPTQIVRYRIFTLDHSMRPHEEKIFVSVINSAGNRIRFKDRHIGLKSVISTNGIYSSQIRIPDVSEPGVWKIMAFYEGDEKNAITQEFQVKKFVLPSFAVSIQPNPGYVQMNLEKIIFIISAKYSYGKSVKGAFHCRFGVKEEQAADREDVESPFTFITGLEQTGSVTDGTAVITLQRAQLVKQLQQHLNTTLSELARTGAHLYVVVSVTDVTSGELQEADSLLPVVSQRYSVDLSRTRSHFIPGVPYHAAVVVRLPNGTPANNVPVQMQVLNADEEASSYETNQEGVVFHTSNIPKHLADLTFEVTVDGAKYNKIAERASSPQNEYLYLSVSSAVVTPKDSLKVEFQHVNGISNEYVYYMVVSRGRLTEWHSVKLSVVTTVSLKITHDMSPFFRLIGYYYTKNGDIIADSVWVDVKDVCEGKIVISSKKEHRPGTQAKLEIDLGDEKAKVALLAVDKAIYSLNPRNKLTAQQVFSSMNSYDLGCSYGGGSDTAAVFNDAGLSFISHSLVSQMRKGFGCESSFRRQRRSLNLQQRMNNIMSTYTNSKQQECCRHGFTLLPMKRTCTERARRVSHGNKGEGCVKAFLHCCLQAEKLRKMDRQTGLARTATEAEIEEFFDTTHQQIRMYFPQSFEFKIIDVDRKTTHPISLPDSITTWEVQAVSFSTSHGFCVAQPFELRAFKDLFVSLNLPYSVKRFEQLSIVAVIYNYGDEEKQLAVQMKPEPGLCSSYTSTYLNVTVAKHSSETVMFSAVPMVTGNIPISIRLYDKEFDDGLDAIQKLLYVRTEGFEKREEKTFVIDLNGKSGKSLRIDGMFPNSTVPDSATNLFVMMEDQVFGQPTVLSLLSADGVEKLLQAPSGCAEQTMLKMAPTALALRYLDLSQLWLELPTGTKDKAVIYIEDGYERILTFKKDNGSYGAWKNYPSSHWLTALVVKVMSLVAERQRATIKKVWRMQKIVSEDHIQASVNYLMSVQNKNGFYTDPNPVIHREMQGGIGGVEKDLSLTAFIAIALYRSLDFLTEEMIENVRESIDRSTAYLLANLEDMKRPYTVAITAYCLSVCLSDQRQAIPAWEKLKKLAITEGECLVWPADASMRSLSEDLVPSTEAITVETTAYALLTAVAHGEMQTANSIACWLSTQENYGGGFKSTQDTIVALEALSEYALRTSPTSDPNINVEFKVTGKNAIEKLAMERKGERVEVELKKLLGNSIDVEFKGHGKAKMKVVKAYHVLEPVDSCDLLSIDVKVEGKVQYTAKVLEDYSYEYTSTEQRREEEEIGLPRSAIQWFDARNRRRRETQESQKSQNAVNYHICVKHEPRQNLSGMAVADITLLSGFEADTNDLDRLKELADQYISHYEVSHGRVLLYFNEIVGGQECITFGATQKVPIGLVQPAPATFFDYYEPGRRCTVFYSAPKRSKMVSTICSREVCECAEKPCHNVKKTIEKKIKKSDRQTHACFYPVVEYAYQVQVQSEKQESNFDLYTTKVTEVLRHTDDSSVKEDSVREFAKRRQCKGKLEVGKNYLIMGKDGFTTDTNGQKRYLLDSLTWVEQIPDENKCKGTNLRNTCRDLKDFVNNYKNDGCTQ